MMAGGSTEKVKVNAPVWLERMRWGHNMALYININTHCAIVDIEFNPVLFQKCATMPKALRKPW